jgi:hypothetical protein
MVCSTCGGEQPFQLTFANVQAFKKRKKGRPVPEY